MSDFDPKKFVEEDKETTDFDPKKFVEEDKEPAKYEQPGFARRLYEQGVVIPVRAARNLMPYGESLQRTMVDPVAAALQGKTMAEKQKEREEYDAYLRYMYPGQLEGAQMGVDVLGALYKPAAVQVTEPLAAQAVEHPESLGLNLDTALSAAPVALAGAMKIPGALAKGVGFIKSRPEARASMRKYEANPELYDTFEAQTGGQPREHMVRTIQEDLNLKKTDKDIRLQAEKDAMEQARAGRSEAAREMAMNKRDIDYQRRNAYEDTRQALQIGAEEGDAAKRIVGELQNNYKKTANQRTDLLVQQGTMHDVTVIDDMFKNAIDNTTDPSQVAALERARGRLKQRAIETTGDETAITPKEFNDFRMYLQDQVTNWGKHMTPAEKGFAKIGRAINDDLDFHIEGNETLRAKIRQQTLDYNDAMDLFGNDYNINQLKSSLKDPQKVAVIDRIAANNPDTPTLADTKSKIAAMDAIEESKRRGIHPVVPAEQSLATAENEKSMAIRRYLEARNKRADISKERLPFTAEATESTINTAMVSNPMHPRVNQTDALANYANTFPGGEDAFWDMYDKNKVLRDLSTMDQAQGSRMTNLGKAVGGSIGGGMSYLSGGSLPDVGLWGAAGAGAGAALDYNASKFYRAGIKTDQAQAGIRRIANAATSTTVEQLQARYGEQATQTAMNSGIPIDKLAGTKYEGPLMKTLQEDPKRAAVVHYISVQNDPEYARLVSGGNE
jgi:hypothetical protein